MPLVLDSNDPERIIVFGSMAENNIHESREDGSRPLRADNGRYEVEKMRSYEDMKIKEDKRMGR